ncbi:hypothetical protein AKJ48_04225 [candidate division MSBL1 archaeon SCGC-AAA261O19]|uniref:Radical SAM core domain-containing protein n=1 Tax=candidate division MSBL1 archaeon SCGC-AAA261O19 TaxID=1698277 RepID=A0A133V9I0_9EURY|nr:hypothetical protein AKJ48_04225 [candidate division MSBL1 archaeon SCGC-AAA261O19]
MPGYDPLELTEKIKDSVVRELERKYYRFRSTRFYGGIATADCVGCNLNCYYCWSEKPRKHPDKIGNFHPPKGVANKLIKIAREKDFTQVRISGNEPTIGKKHLVEVLGEIQDTGLRFILETNGILIGQDPQYAQELAQFPNLHTRVSLKGCNPQHFHELTGANPQAFDLQLQALENLLEAECECHSTIMRDLATPQQLHDLMKRLGGIDPNLPHSLDFEQLKLYPHVRKRLKKQGLI